MKKLKVMKLTKTQSNLLNVVINYVLTILFVFSLHSLRLMFALSQLINILQTHPLNMDINYLFLVSLVVLMY